MHARLKHLKRFKNNLGVIDSIYCHMVLIGKLKINSDEKVPTGEWEGGSICGRYHYDLRCKGLQRN